MVEDTLGTHRDVESLEWDGDGEQRQLITPS